MAELYRLYGPMVFARCRRMLKDEQAAADAAQEVFIRVLRRLDRAPPVAARAWVHRITTNYCLNLIRDRSHRASAREALPVAESPCPQPALAERDLVLSLVRHAPERLSAPAVLHFVEGLEHGQVAHRLGVSRRTVINRINSFCERARRYVALHG